MKWLALKTWLTLFFVDATVRLWGFKGLHKAVSREEVRQLQHPISCSRDDICRAVDLACVFYFRQVSLLERSAATALALRRKGWAAYLVLGAKIFPYETYAWVELEGKVVNDQPNLLDVYQVLERC
jgi:hypothetical protein